MKRVLMVVYHFPPSASVAAHRPHKFAKYLPEFGWSPTVLCRQLDPQYPFDPSFVDELDPNLPIRRINPVEPLRFLAPFGLPGVMIRRLAALPDEQIGWMARLLRDLPEQIRRCRPDAVFISSVPHSSLIGAGHVANQMRVPYVADFHNEWTRNCYYKPATPLHDFANRWFEKRILETASAVVTLNPVNTDHVRSLHPGGRYATIENGFEPSDFEGLPAAPRRRRPVLLYAGTSYGHQKPEAVLNTLAEIGADVEVRILGDLFGQVKDRGWPFPMHIQRNVAHRDLPAKLADADGLFLSLMPPAARQLPAKIYEYAASRRPILGLVSDDSSAATFIRRVKCGTVVDSARPETWKDGIAGYLKNLRPPSIRMDELRKHERRTQAGQLADVLDAIR